MAGHVSTIIHRKMMADLPNATAAAISTKFHQRYLDDMESTVKTMLDEIRQANLGIGCSVCYLTETELDAADLGLVNYTGCSHVICHRCLILDEPRRRVQKTCHCQCRIKRGDKLVTLFFI